jgi:hypothetical protein
MPKIHCAGVKATMCGIELFGDIIIAFNPKRTTCRNCLKTVAYRKALAALKRRHNGGRDTVQMDLFSEEVK